MDQKLMDRMASALDDTLGKHDLHDNIRNTRNAVSRYLDGQYATKKRMLLDTRFLERAASSL